MLQAFTLAAALAAVTALPALAAQEDPTPGDVAFLGIQFVDTSSEGAYFGEPSAERARIGLLEEMVRERFVAEGYTLMDLAPIREDLDRIANPANCYGCDVRMAQKLGADYVLVGVVQKVSTLIVTMNLVLKDAGDGALLRGQSVDVRENIDESWLRGMRYILKNYIFREGGS